MNRTIQTKNETEIKKTDKNENLSYNLNELKSIRKVTLTAGSRPAIPAYAKACGITVKPTVTPATKSPTKSSVEYL